MLLGVPLAYHDALPSMAVSSPLPGVKSRRITVVHFILTGACVKKTGTAVLRFVVMLKVPALWLVGTL